MSAVRPIPVPDERSEGFWAAAASHQLTVQQCDACGRLAHPPVIICHACLSPKGEFHFEPVSGHGRVKTWTVMHNAFIPAFSGDVPYVVAEVLLDEQENLRMVGLLEGADPAALRIGDRVHTVWEDIADGPPVPHFALGDGR